MAISSGDRIHAPRPVAHRLDLLADPAGLLLAVPMADQADLLAVLASVHSVLPSRPLLAAITPEAAARICGVER
jgi:hypothetical protein